MTVSLPLQDSAASAIRWLLQNANSRSRKPGPCKQRTRQRPGQAGPDCFCLVAVKQSDSSSAEVVGTLDVEPTGPAPAQDQKVPKVRLSLREVGGEEGDQSICLRDVICICSKKHVTITWPLICRVQHMCSTWWSPASHRRQGIGIMLMAAANDMAKQEWASSKMCARVSAQNHVGFPHNLSLAS